MKRLVAVLLAGLAFAPAALADEFPSWRAGVEAAGIEGDPWMSRSGFIPEDAYVFAEVAQSAALEAETVAIAIQSDMDRMTHPAADAAARATAVTVSRVAAAFERFAPVGADGRAYASLELARGRTGPATLTREVRLLPAVLAMSLPSR